jgi:hypothetical protein
VAAKIGIQVELRYPDPSTDRVHTVRFKYLFRFFRYALRFNTATNRAMASGQFVRASGDTVVMLPPNLREGREERQIPLFLLKPVYGQPTAFELRRAPDAPMDLIVDGELVGHDAAVRIDLLSPVEVLAQPPEAVGDRTETVKYTLTPLERTVEERRRVAANLPDRQYVAFISISSDCVISLSKTEIVIGRGRLLNGSVAVRPQALTLVRRYVTWVMTADRNEAVFYYCTVHGVVTKPVTKMPRNVSLGVMGTYYVYVGDFEFTILLESTPLTEILLANE